MIELFFKLVIGHFLADFPLQGDFLSKAKNYNTAIPHVPPFWAMAAHCAIQAGMVWLITNHWGFALIEFMAHWVIDALKIENEITFSGDQIMHILCKLLYVLMIYSLFS